MRARLPNVNANSKHKSRIWKWISSLKITLSRTRVVTAGNTYSTYFVTLVNLPSTDMCKPNFFSFRNYFWVSGFFRFLIFLFEFYNETSISYLTVRASTREFHVQFQDSPTRTVRDQWRTWRTHESVRRREQQASAEIRGSDVRECTEKLEKIEKDWKRE